jgi:hypothetical protein
LKKAWLYIIFFILLLNQTSLNQLFKFPALIAHFFEHHGQDNKVGFVDFLFMHYGGNDHNDKDDARDMKLPFKKVDHSSSFSIALPAAKTTIDKQKYLTRAILFTGFKNFHINNPALSSLFRPPRV